MAPSSVLYYYPDIAELLLEVGRGAMDRYADGRARAVRETAGALPSCATRLRSGFRLGPTTTRAGCSTSWTR